MNRSLELPESEETILTPDKTPRTIDDLKTFEREVEATIRQWIETNAGNTFYVAFDGLPGAGKTTLMSALKNICARLGIQLSENGVDSFIQTNRDDPMRYEMTRDHELFKRLYYSRESVKNLLEASRKTNGHGTTIHFEKMYDRRTGKVVPGSIVLPRGRKVMLLEGVNAIPFMQELKKKGETVLKVHVFAKPQTAMHRAIQRDTKNGSRKADEAHRLRSAEYQHLVGPVNEKNPHMADIVFLQE